MGLGFMQNFQEWQLVLARISKMTNLNIPGAGGGSEKYILNLSLLSTCLDFFWNSPIIKSDWGKLFPKLEKWLTLTIKDKKVP